VGGSSTWPGRWHAVALIAAGNDRDGRDQADCERRAVGADLRLFARGAGGRMDCDLRHHGDRGQGQIVGRGDMYVQARQAIDNLAAALERAGMSLADVVRTRVFVTDMTRFEEVARAHRERFGAHPPCSTLVEVRRLVDPDMLIEIEADAWAEPLASIAPRQAPLVKARAKKRTTTRAKAVAPKRKIITRKA
jgi:enamine deaminase RidA (YjgF/YER057c/UK114 family)